MTEWFLIRNRNLYEIRLRDNKSLTIFKVIFFSYRKILLLKIKVIHVTLRTRIFRYENWKLCKLLQIAIIQIYYLNFGLSTQITICATLILNKWIHEHLVAHFPLLSTGYCYHCSFNWFNSFSVYYVKAYFVRGFLRNTLKVQPGEISRLNRFNAF